MTNPTATTRTSHRNTDISCAHPAPEQADTTHSFKIVAYALGIPITGYFALFPRERRSSARLHDVDGDMVPICHKLKKF